MMPPPGHKGRGLHPEAAAMTKAERASAMNERFVRPSDGATIWVQCSDNRGIAVIARDRNVIARDRKSKILPRIDADERGSEKEQLPDWQFIGGQGGTMAGVVTQQTTGGVAGDPAPRATVKGSLQLSWRFWRTPETGV